MEVVTASLETNGYSVRERYWASYIALAEVTCQTLEELWDEGVDEGWNTRQASIRLETWVEAATGFVSSLEGFGSVSDDEAMSISVAAMHAGFCWYIFEDFWDFVGG